MALPLLLAASLLATPALAKGKKKKGGDDEGIGIRAKISTDLINVATDKVEYDGQEQDGSDQKTRTLSLFESDPRLELTYLIGDGIEVGAILGVTQVSGSLGDEDIPPARHGRIGVTGAYNIGVSEGVKGFVQPILMLDSLRGNIGEDSETQTRYILFGANAGVRIKLYKRTTFDLAGEFLMGNGKVTVDGESDDKLKLKHSEFGIRTGVTFRL